MAIEIISKSPSQVLIGISSKKREELEDVSIQVATGNKYPTYERMAAGGEVEKYISLRSTNDGLTDYIRSNELISSRVKTMRQSIDDLSEIASEYAQLVANRRNDAVGTNLPVLETGRALLDRIANNLNIKFDGRYLFAGSKTNTAPVSNIQTSNIGNDNLANTRYYAGDSVKATVRSSDTQEVEYGILANESAFQKLIGAIHLGMDGHTNEDDTKLSQSMDMINEAIVELTSVRTSASSTITNIDNTIINLENTQQLISENLGEVGNVDIVEASTRLSELDAIVQASFLAYNRLSRLQLSNFLN
ncbi:flagellin [Rickettsiales bacterium]|nr:flagellin [Rickettsiales bacterium]